MELTMNTEIFHLAATQTNGPLAQLVREMIKDYRETVRMLNARNSQILDHEPTRRGAIQGVYMPTELREKVTRWQRVARSHATIYDIARQVTG